MTATTHHANAREVSPGIWDVARPMRDSSPWHRWKQERACGKATGHCWHPESLIGWWCCMCSAGDDGMPSRECVYCYIAQKQQRTEGSGW